MAGEFAVIQVRHTRLRCAWISSGCEHHLFAGVVVSVSHTCLFHVLPEPDDDRSKEQEY